MLLRTAGYESDYIKSTPSLQRFTALLRHHIRAFAEYCLSLAKLLIT